MPCDFLTISVPSGELFFIFVMIIGLLNSSRIAALYDFLLTCLEANEIDFKGYWMCRWYLVKSVTTVRMDTVDWRKIENIIYFDINWQKKQ